jgi:HSP20 family protein
VQNEPEQEGRLLSVERLRQELDRWLDVAVTQSERALDAVGFRGSEKSWTPRADVFEHPDKIQVDVELPGIDPESVDVSLAGNMLTIRGGRIVPPAEPGVTVHVRERRVGPFVRSIPMPFPVNVDNVTAEARNGVLHIRVAKAEPVQSRPVRVTVQH